MKNRLIDDYRQFSEDKDERTDNNIRFKLILFGILIFILGWLSRGLWDAYVNK